MDSTQLTILVDIEVIPGSLEVGTEVVREGGSLEALMGLEDLRGSSLGGGLSHTENTVGGSVLVLVLNSVGHDHRLHEEIVGTSGEVLWWDSLVFLIEWTGANLSGLEDLLGVILLFLL